MQMLDADSMVGRPQMGGKDFPRGSSMTVLWVSHLQKRCGFPYSFPPRRQKSAGQGHLELKRFPRQVQPPSSHRADWRVMSEVDIFVSSWDRNDTGRVLYDHTAHCSFDVCIYLIFSVFIEL